VGVVWGWCGGGVGFDISLDIKTFYPSLPFLSFLYFPSFNGLSYPYILSAKSLSLQAFISQDITIILFCFFLFFLLFCFFLVFCVDK
jgi:hypothetical protein